MRFAKILILLTCVAFMGACSCKIRRAGGNIPVAAEGMILKDVRFAFDRYDLDQGSQDLLKANAEWLTANEDAKVEIEGHCDERGTNEYNMALGERRGRVVKKIISTLGLEGSRMRVISKGEEEASGRGEDGWSKDRRVEFK